MSKRNIGHPEDCPKCGEVCDGACSNEPLTPDEYATDAIEIFKSFYKPAQTFKNADQFMTTMEIINMIRDIRPDMQLEAELIFANLKIAGFRYETISPGNLRWLLKSIDFVVQ